MTILVFSEPSSLRTLSATVALVSRVNVSRLLRVLAFPSRCSRVRDSFTLLSTGFPVTVMAAVRLVTLPAPSAARTSTVNVPPVVQVCWTDVPVADPPSPKSHATPDTPDHGSEGGGTDIATDVPAYAVAGTVAAPSVGPTASRAATCATVC